jgi:3-deoxy-D-manno-octulosonate 8-phosphate phosphatase (KDO 8-P phosphatase)
MIALSDIDAFVIDFDGVLTNNKVHLDENGKEWVSCSRSDGLAFDVLRKLQMPVYIFSTETNPVVSARANKLEVPVIQGVKSKFDGIKELANTEGYNLKNIIYVGNDLNDYHAMQLCGFSFAPADSHPKIKELATEVLKSNGGNGAIRELIEDVLQIDFLKTLYIK